MATATQQHKTKHHAFPRKLGRFINLEGGLYGTIDLVAITDDVLELQTGEDFVRFDRAQATNLRDTIDKFLAFEKREHRPEGEEVEAVEEVATVVEEQETITRARRPRRRRKSA